MKGDMMQNADKEVCTSICGWVGRANALQAFATLLAVATISLIVPTSVWASDKYYGSGDATNEDDGNGNDNGCDTDPAGCCDDSSNNSSNPSHGNPIFPISGRATERRTDLVVEGAVPIKMVRIYDSRRNYDSPVGYGWAWRD